MCLALPGEILAISGDDVGLSQATVAFGSVKRVVTMVLLPEAKIGDFVLVHAGFAIALVDAARATATLAEIGALESFETESQ